MINVLLWVLLWAGWDQYGWKSMKYPITNRPATTAINSIELRCVFVIS